MINLKWSLRISISFITPLLDLIPDFPAIKKTDMGFFLSVFRLSMSELTDIFNDNTNLSNKIWEE